jgi:glycosyltransferase A (GT-A) superfamily protein (DUF2064 family)
MRALVVAKAPVAGRVKTRLGAVIGMDAAARVAAAALLDTLAVCREAFDECHLSLAGDLRSACEEEALRDQLTGWVVHRQYGATLGERLARAHADAGGSGPTVQVGMDTPQLTAADLRDAAVACGPGRAALGPAADGGWWVLALPHPTAAAELAGVPMSRPDTCLRTRAALEHGGLAVAVVRMLRDVDTVADAVAVADGLAGGHFRQAWHEVSR